MTGALENDNYDLIVIGAGPIGENVADYATKRGLRVAIVESELVGGECSYWACMPSKALLRTGHALRAARRLPGTAGAIGSLDAAEVLGRRDAFTDHRKDDDQVAWLDAAGIDLIRGHGRLVGPRRVQVGDTVYSADAVALSTGSLPVLPAIPGLAAAAPWGTREATSADRVPDRLIVIGGGVAGTELAFAFSSLGSVVTVIARERLLEREEPFVGDHVAAALRDEDVKVILDAAPARVDRDAQGTVTVTLDDGSLLHADEMLVATGRRPNTDDLGLETIGLPAGATLSVDDTLLVNGTDWLYAVGDVNGRALLTHQGKYQARAAGEAIAARRDGTPLRVEPWGQHAATADHVAVPRVVFTDPEVAAVGHTEVSAVRAGLRVRAIDYDLGWVAGAKLHADGYTGRAKLIIDEDRKLVVGATFVGQDVAELVHAATIAIVGEVAIDRLWHAVPAYPTISEVWLRLLETYGRPD